MVKRMINNTVRIIFLIFFCLVFLNLWVTVKKKTKGQTQRREEIIGNTKKRKKINLQVYNHATQIMTISRGLVGGYKFSLKV